MDTDTRVALQGIADNARVARDDMRDRDQRPIGGQLHRMEELLTTAEVKITQVEDRLGPVRSPMERVLLDHGQPVVPVSPLAETLRTHGDTLEHLIMRLEQLLADVEL